MTAETASGPGEARHIPGPCDPGELRTLFLFEKLSAGQLDVLCREGHIEVIPPGPVFAEGDPATCFYVLLDGGLVLSRRVGADDVEVVRSSDRGVYAGAFTAYFGDRVPQVYTGSLRVTEPSRFYVLDADVFGRVMRDWFPMAVHLLEGLFFGNRNTQLVIGERERLLALGSLSAGLTHELNNPASAAVRATSALRERIAGLRSKLRSIAAKPFSPEALETLIVLQTEAVERVAKAPALSPIETSDREDELTDWLDDAGVPNGWELAPAFVQAGLDTAWLDRLCEAVAPALLPGALVWVHCAVETEILINEIEDSTNRISTLVGAAKQYSQLDRAPYQVADVHELLDSTLMMLGAKIGDGITVVRDYAPGLPRIPAYAAELNQVWTNLIDNAVDAMGGSGTLTVRTALDGDRDEVLVEIGDTGPGIPREIRNRIFEPFFTTKDVGQGTGLGLDISWRIVVKKHHGDIRVESSPGGTRFQVRLPLTPAEGEVS
jgi:signal transduction histidine kinase